MSTSRLGDDEDYYGPHTRWERKIVTIKATKNQGDADGIPVSMDVLSIEVPALVAVGTGLAITHQNGKSGSDYVLTHIASGRSVSKDTVAPTQTIAKRWLERVLSLIPLDWNRSMEDLVQEAHNLRLEGVLLQGSIGELIQQAYEQGCERAREDEGVLTSL